MPRRIRGVVLGLATLVIGPLLAVLIVAPGRLPATAVRTASASPAHVVASTTGTYGHPRIPELWETQPTPVPTPAPTPTPKPKPVVTPAPTHRPVAPAVVYPPGSIRAIITAAAQAHGVDPAWMIRIASCESGERPNAVSSNGMYFGLYQFLPSTFKAHGGTNIFDPTQQANITAAMLKAGGARSWPVCSKW